jgi:hypothetical protein
MEETAFWTHEKPQEDINQANLSYNSHINIDETYAKEK